MGNKGARGNKNQDLKKIGEEANKNSPSQFNITTNINLTNDVIVGKAKINPGNDYVILKVLGGGDNTKVYKVKNKYSNLEYAMKVIKKSNENKENDANLNEIEMLKKMDHPSIIKILEFYSDETNFNIVTELCPGEDLFSEIIEKGKGPFNEKYVAFVMYQILSAVNYFHNLNIIHRDLKPEHILVVEKNKDNIPIIKICDFGSSIILGKSDLKEEIKESINYMAPEVLNKKYDNKCDIWSCGVIMYFLLTRKLPFISLDADEIRENILSGKYDLKSPPFDKLSKNCINLIENLLNKNPNKRFSAEKALNHEWFKDFSSKESYNKLTDYSVIKTLYNNLIKYKYKPKSIVQETAMAYLVHQFPQDKEVINACKLFNQIDKNCDGKISKKELYDGLIKTLNLKSLEKDIDSIFKYLDRDNSGSIEYEEFVTAAVSKDFFSGKVELAFRYFDKDGSNEIDLEEIKALFSDCIDEKNDTEQIMNQIIKEVDTNNDGKINLKEFSIFMEKMIG